MHSGNRKALWGSSVALILALAVLPRSGLAGDLRRFPDYASEPAVASEKATVEALKEMLDEARERRDEKEGEARGDDPAVRTPTLLHATPPPSPARTDATAHTARKPGAKSDDASVEKAGGKTGEKSGEQTGEKSGEEARDKSLEAAQADDEKQSAPPVEASQAGCMYRGRKLIWEKVPGSCSL